VSFFSGPPSTGFGFCVGLCVVCSLSSLVFLGGFNVQVYKNFGRYIYFSWFVLSSKEGKSLEDSGVDSSFEDFK